MKKILSAMFVLLLAAVIAASVFTASASAASADPGVGLAPGINAQFWFTDTGLTTQYPQKLTINGAIYNFTLGNNTIQEYWYNSATKTYVVSAHPQFFGTAIPIDYDEQANAYYIMNITEILVHDTSTDTYVDCFDKGVAIIPAEYAQENPDEELYLECLVYSTIVDVRTGAESDADWNGVTVYLQIPTL